MRDHEPTNPVACFTRVVVARGQACRVKFKLVLGAGCWAMMSNVGTSHPVHTNINDVTNLYNTLFSFSTLGSEKYRRLYCPHRPRRPCCSHSRFKWERPATFIESFVRVSNGTRQTKDRPADGWILLARTTDKLHMHKDRAASTRTLTHAPNQCSRARSATLSAHRRRRTGRRMLTDAWGWRPPCAPP